MKKIIIICIVILINISQSYSQQIEKEIAKYAIDLSDEDFSRATYSKENPSHYSKLKLMGEYLAEEYGDKLYVMAFTHSTGAHGEALDISFEKQIINRGLTTAYIDFTSLKCKKEFYNKKFNASIIRNKAGYWMDIFDGIFFFERETVAIPIKIN